MAIALKISGWILLWIMAVAVISLGVISIFVIFYEPGKYFLLPFCIFSVCLISTGLLGALYANQKVTHLIQEKINELESRR